MKKITEELFSLQDVKYRDFQLKLIPGIKKESMIGVRTPVLRSLAKKIYKERPEDAKAFLGELPHEYFDENQLHAFILSEQKDFNSCINYLEDFLPYINNWATCDQLSPKIFRKNHSSLLPYIQKWLDSNHTYTIRFAVGMLMQHFLEDDFSPEFLELAACASDSSSEYYVRMMVTWYFATALAKQYEAALPCIQKNRLDVWTHNKAIQKSLESFRIPDDHKEYLRTLKRK